MGKITLKSKMLRGLFRLHHKERKESFLFGFFSLFTYFWMENLDILSLPHTKNT